MVAAIEFVPELFTDGDVQRHPAVFGSLENLSLNQKFDLFGVKGQVSHVFHRGGHGARYAPPHVTSSFEPAHAKRFGFSE